MRFRSVVVLGGKTATGFRVPADVVARLGRGKRPPVRVTIAGHMYRSTVAVMGGEYWLGISAEVRAMTGARAGEEVDVDVELDTEPREVVVPADFAAALDGDGEARRAFDAMSYSNRRRLVMAVDDAKTDETRVRRIGRTVELLREGRA